MNEVTRIHLGREPLVISVEAHHALKTYLAAIKKQVSDTDVLNEIELRMAELLNERGISGEKVVLLEDIDYLKQQLGSPTDFSDEEGTPRTKSTTEQGDKRLFRDTDNGMLAGVAAGVANYFGLDVTLVRLLFIALAIFSAGFGIVFYILLWLVIPPATTSSEKLQMRGVPVTVDAIKESVSKADLPGAAKRGSSAALSVLDAIFRFTLKVTGIGFIVLGLATIFGLIATKTYMLLHHGQLFQENFFPVGNREQWLATLILCLTAILSVFAVLVGVSIFRRKWPLRGWATGVLVGIFLIGLAACIGLSADVAPGVRTRYETSMHTTGVANIQPFDTVTTTGGVDVEYLFSPQYSVSYHYYGHPDLSKIKVGVTGKTLHIDSTAFDGSRHCTMLCLFPEYNMVVQVAAPNVQKFDMPAGAELTYPGYPSAAAQPGWSH